MEKKKRKKKKSMSNEEYKQLCVKKHGDTYILDDVEYISMKKYVYPTCRNHGRFKICAYDFAHLRGCPHCGRENRKRKPFKRKRMNMSFDEFKAIAEPLHDYKYKYIRNSFINLKEKMKMICPIHGEFEQPPYSHLNGHGCEECGIIKRSLTQNTTNEGFIDKCTKVHNGYYIYTHTKYKGCYDDVEVICPKHGLFTIPAYSHLQGHGCRKCANENNSLRLLKPLEEFIDDAKKVHPNEDIDYSKVEYRGAKVPVEFICPNGHHYFQSPNKHLSGHGCKYCARIVSSYEMELQEFLKSINIEFEGSNRKILSKSKELDIYIPSRHIAIEFNGLYWHSTDKRDALLHLTKTEECLSKGINLIHIFEDEWNFKRDIVKSMLRDSLEVYGETVDSNSCSVREISTSVARDFLNTNNINGYKSSKYKYGLYTPDDELVSVITFGNYNKENDSYEITSFSNKLNINVINAPRTLINHFTNQHTISVLKVVLDRRFCAYKQFIYVGFKHVDYTKPNRFYIDGKNRVTKKPIIDGNYYEIYDCGDEIMELKIN